MSEYGYGFRIRRNPDGTLPHVMPGAPRHSMYDGTSTTTTVNMILVDAGAIVDETLREPIRVEAYVGRPILEIDDAEPWAPQP